MGDWTQWMPFVAPANSLTHSLQGTMPCSQTLSHSSLLSHITSHHQTNTYYRWRSPGHAGRGNPDFQPCGVNSGALASQPEPPTTAKDVPNGGPGTSLPPLPKHEWAVWKAGSVVEAEWAIYANHGTALAHIEYPSKHTYICIYIHNIHTQHAYMHPSLPSPVHPSIHLHPFIHPSIH